MEVEVFLPTPAPRRLTLLIAIKSKTLNTPMRIASLGLYICKIKQGNQYTHSDTVLNIDPGAGTKYRESDAGKPCGKRNL